jgi:hypothetical protein
VARALLVRAVMRTFALLVCALVGCADLADAGKGPEDDVPGDLDGKADSQRTPTDLGAIASGQTVTASLSSSARYLAWEFDVAGDADLSLDTSRPAHAATIDTVMYLYKQSASGTWGSYIARNDDAAGSVYSTIDKHVGAGRYRVLVKAYTTTTYGKLALSYTCSGAGCTAAPSCAFGASFGEIDPAAFTVGAPVHLTAASIPALGALAQQQIISAMHASTHTDVATIADAFAAADQGEIDQYAIDDLAAVRRFTAFEYGAGDNPYGRIFAFGSTAIASDIHDGDLLPCNVTPAVCVFGRAAGAYAANPALAIGTSINYASTSSVAVAVQGEIVASLRSQRPQVQAIEDVWAQVDGGKVRRVDVTHADGRAFTIVTYALGGQTYGAAFAKGTTTRVVSITNGATADCSAY